MKTRSISLKVILCGIAQAIVSMCALAQGDTKLLRERTPDEQPMLMVLAVAHFSNPGLDLANVKVDDVLSEARQAEIRAVVERLASFRPTHVAVEWPRKGQDTLDAHYRDYRQGRYLLGRGEVDQLGLRLAAKLGLTRVDAVDWNELPTGDQKYYDWLSYAQSHGPEAWASALADPHRVIGVVQLGTQSILAWLLQLNRPEALAGSHRNYFDLATVGDEQQQPGANWAGYWYGRNLRIFGNLVRLTDRPEDRILVIYGQGHAYLLRQFAGESGAFRLQDAGAILKK